MTNIPENLFAIYETPSNIVVLIDEVLLRLMEDVATMLGEDEVTVSIFEELLNSSWGVDVMSSNMNLQAKTYCIDKTLKAEEYRCGYYPKTTLYEYNIDKDLLVAHIKIQLNSAMAYYKQFKDNIEQIAQIEEYTYKPL